VAQPLLAVARISSPDVAQEGVPVPPKPPRKCKLSDCDEIDPARRNERRGFLTSVIGAKPIAERRGPLYDEIISGLEDCVAKRTGITERCLERQYRRAAPGVQEQLQDESDLAA